MKGLEFLMKLYMREINKENEENEVMALLKGIPKEDIDHWQTDLYLRKTPEVTSKVINKLPDTYKKNVTTFRDNIDHDIWYEIPFVFPRQVNRKGVKESLDKTLPITFSGQNINVAVTDKWPTGKKVWNIGNHNPYINKGYVIVCNTRNYTVIPETLEFVYVGADNAKALHKEAGKHTVNDKNYKKYLVANIDLDESVFTEDEIETWDVSFWDTEEEESYDIKTVRKTRDEVKKYVDKLNANRTEREKENGSFYSYVLA